MKGILHNALFLKWMLMGLLMLGTAMTAWAEPKVQFQKKEYDFGYISENDGKVTCSFEFVNNGDKPLVIIDAKAECGCTTPDFPRRPIEAGGKGVIKVTYNPKDRPGAFRKEITVRTNGKPKRTTLVVIGSVKK